MQRDREPVYGVTIENTTAALEAVRPLIERWTGEEPAVLWDALERPLRAECALPLIADGAVLLAEDIATGVTVARGVCRYPPENGCGVQLSGTSARGVR